MGKISKGVCHSTISDIGEIDTLCQGKRLFGEIKILMKRDANLPNFNSQSIKGMFKNLNRVMKDCPIFVRSDENGKPLRFESEGPYVETSTTLLSTIKSFLNKEYCISKEDIKNNINILIKFINKNIIY